MTKHTIKILGVQFAANPDYKFGDPETPEMWARTRAMLSELRDMRPRVVLKAEPTNPSDEKAVMARAMGRKIGYVNRDQRDDVRRLLKGSKRGMLVAEVGEVVMDNHGYLYVTLHCEDDAVAEEQEMGFDWQGWHADAPLLPPMEALDAEEEAAFILEEELLPRLAEVNTTELQAYLGIWMEGSRHDMSLEASSQRRLFIRRLEESQRDEVRTLAKELEHQSASMSNRHRLEERVQAWWPQVVASAEAETMWVRWREQTNGQLLEGLGMIDARLRQLPGGIYENIGHLETVFAQLYYLCIPRTALTAILSLLVLRVRTCRELGIEMKPMTEADSAGCEPSESNSISMKDLAKEFLKFPAKIALGMYGGVSTLLAGHPSWQKHSSKIQEQILAQAQAQQDRQEEREDRMMETMKEAASKPTNEFKVYPQAGSTANVGCQMHSPEFKVIPPSDGQQPALENKNNDDER